MLSMRSELLACFGSVYKFISRNYSTPVMVWASVHKELRWIYGLIPLA